MCPRISASTAGHERAIAVDRELAEGLALVVDEQRAEDHGKQDKRKDGAGDEQEETVAQLHARN